MYRYDLEAQKTNGNIISKVLSHPVRTVKVHTAITDKLVTLVELSTFMLRTNPSVLTCLLSSSNPANGRTPKIKS